jgi:hypothetical protein
MGALYQTYAKNLARFGNRSSEAVIFIRELCVPGDGSSKPTTIGSYVEQVDIGRIIGLVVQYKAGKIDGKSMSRAMRELLKKITSRKQHAIKEAIIAELKNSIDQDNTKYTHLEQAIIDLAQKKERTELELALEAVSKNWNPTTETVILNKLTHGTQRKLWHQLKDLHRTLRHNRTLLDTEQRSLEVSSPMLKDSISAFTQALIGAVAEERTIYLDNHTINLLLACLWQKAQAREDILEALQAAATTMSVEPQALFHWQNPKPYTLKEYKELQSKTEAEIATLPLEDLVFARLGSASYQKRTTGPSAAFTQLPHAAVYFHSLVNLLQNTHDAQQQATLASLVASWASQWSELQNMDPQISYCRFFMQDADSLAEQIGLVLDICEERITMGSMVPYYVETLNSIYQTLPKEFDAQQMFFDIIFTCIISNNSEQLVTHLKKECLQWIAHTDNDITKAAIIAACIKHHIFDSNTIENFNPFGKEQNIVKATHKLESDANKAHLLKLIPTLDISHNEQSLILKQLYEWALQTLRTIQDEAAQATIIAYIIENATEQNSILKEYYMWATDAIDGIQDDSNKAQLVIAALTTSKENLSNKHAKILCTTLINKTLPSITSEKAMLKIMVHLVKTYPCKDIERKELYDSAYGWLAQKLPLMHSSAVKSRLITALLDHLALVTESQDNAQQDTIYNAIEKGLQSIHDAQIKTKTMESLLNRQAYEQMKDKKLYTNVYQWVERNIPSIKDAAMRESMLHKLLHVTKSIKF